MENIWNKELKLAMEGAGESIYDVVFATQRVERLRPPFTVWTQDRVYFPVVDTRYGMVVSVPRNPCQEEVESFMDW